MSQEEDDLIIRMHKLLGNRWSLIAGRLPGRTDNEVKNYWNTHLNKRCLRVKRKTRDSSKCHSEQGEKKTGRKSCCRKRNAQPICSTSPESTTLEVKGKKEENEENRVDETRVQEAQSINYYIESPIMSASNAAFLFEDDPFTDYLNYSGLFESLGCSANADEIVQLGWSML